MWDPATETFVESDPVLRFDTHSQNLGTVAVDLTADDPTALEGSTVSQCVSWTAPLLCAERRQVGGFTLHPDHGHFHFDGFASYELRRIRRNGQVVWSNRGLIGTSPKVSFCLVDSQQVDPAANPVPTYVLCNSVREGISPGWADVYTSDLEGQEFSLAGLTDGLYALVVTMDPQDRLFESDNGNNRLIVTVKVSNNVSTVEIVDKRLG